VEALGRLAHLSNVAEGKRVSDCLAGERNLKKRMFRWYVINTYSGHENKVKQNLEHRVSSLNQSRAVRRVVVPTETVQEMKDNQKVTVEKRTMPGYVLVNMDLNEDSWAVVKGTPGVTGFVGASNEPIPLTQMEVDRLLHRSDVAVRAPSRAQFSIGESVKVISGPLSDFSGEISEINEDASKLKVLVSIFGRETPVEVGYDQVKKI
jgi:transcription termination/antitermination protein NusG